MEPTAEFWKQPLPALWTALDAGPLGLSTAEAGRRARTYGPNAIRPTGLGKPLHELMRLLGNPLVVILLVAAGLSAGMGDGLNAAIIVVVVAVSVLLDGWQTHRSLRAAEALRRSVATRASVLRDGAWQERPADEVVPGDVVRLAAGDMVPADARLIASKDLYTDEAALTGESLPAEKHADEPRGPAPAGGSRRGTTDGGPSQAAVFAGTSVLSGTATAVVVHVGASTTFGAIAARLADEPPPTEFERGLARFSVMILRIVVVLVTTVFLALALVRRDPIEAMLFAVALAVGLTPEFLPMIVTITLARGAVQMARDGVIVKQLQAIENFGAIDVLCTDKTGTLTTSTLALTRWLDGRGQPCEEARALAVLNSRHETGLRSPLDEAILREPHEEPAGWTKLDEVPFDFYRRRMSVVLAHGDGRTMIVKGAPEGVLAACGTILLDGALRPLDAQAREQATATYRALGEEGLRVLAIARREVTSPPPYGTADERDLVLVGFLAFADPPRTDAKETIAALARDGVRVVMLTGDEAGVASRVANAVGLRGDRLLTGQDLAAIRDEALPQVAETTDVFARMSPEQKTRVVLALKRGGRVVGYLGDGINDAPSLRTADVGISVDGAVDVAREAAPIILTRQDLGTLHRGLRTGRHSFTNVMKCVMMETSSNFGNMVSMAVAATFLPFLPMLPIQILLNNMLYDLAQISLPGDQVDPGALERPRRWDVGFVQSFMLHLGPVSSLFDFLTFGMLLWVFAAPAALFQTGWFVESLLTQTLVIFVIRTRGNPFTSRPSAGLALTVLAIAGVALVLPFSPLAPLLGFVPLPASLLGAIAALGLAYLALAEVMKRRFYRLQGA